MDSGDQLISVKDKVRDLSLFIGVDCVVVGVYIDLSRNELFMRIANLREFTRNYSK